MISLPPFRASVTFLVASISSPSLRRRRASKATAHSPIYASSTLPGINMYLPAHFTESRIKVLHECIAQHPFGSLITYGKNGLEANHIPFDLTEGEGAFGVLRAHVARANPIWHDVENGDEVLVTFQAGDAYISPNWYPSKLESHRQVPTWNYIVVHAHGRIRFNDDESFLRRVVAKLTRTHEASQTTPWKMSDAPADYIDSLLHRIVGLQIDITRIIGKRKLGQDEVARDIQGAGQALKECGNRKIGDAMMSHVDDELE